MDETPKPEDNLTEEFRNLGKNLADALRAAWDAPERKKLKQDIETGLNDLGTTMKQEIETLRDSPTGQRVKSDVDDLRDRLRSGEVESKVRGELVSALRMINTELQKVIERVSPANTQAPAQQAPPSAPDSQAPGGDESLMGSS
jgi:hypothetical protein